MITRRETRGTIASFDASERSGTILLDDGVLLPYAASALAGSGVRGLRLGQRMRVLIDGEGATQTVAALTIITLPWSD